MSANNPFGPRRPQQPPRPLLVDLTDDDSRTHQPELSQGHMRNRIPMNSQQKPPAEHQIVEISSDSETEATPKTREPVLPARTVQIQSPYRSAQTTPRPFSNNVVNPARLDALRMSATQPRQVFDPSAYRLEEAIRLHHRLLPGQGRSAINTPNIRANGPTTVPHAPNSAPSLQSMRSPKLVQSQAEKTCATCKADGVTCDGLEPCDRCLNRSKSCTYANNTDKERLWLQGHRTENASSLLRQHNSTTRIPNGHARSIGPDPALLSSSPERPQTPSVTSAVLKGSDNSAHDSSSDARPFEMPDSVLKMGQTTSNTIPTTFDDVSSLIRKYQKDLDAHREYLLQALLNQAKLDMKKAPSARSTVGRTNPFGSMIEQAKTNSISSGGPDAAGSLLSVKTSRGTGPKRFVPTRIPAQDIQADTTTPILPKYKSIGRLGSSFLSRNQHTLKYKPYFVADEQTDATNDEKDKELDDLFKFDESQFFAQKRCQENVGRWRPFFPLILEELGISVFEVQAVVGTPSWSRKCPGCKVHRSWKFDMTNVADEPPPENFVLVARKIKWLAQAMEEGLSLALWHFVDKPRLNRAQMAAALNGTKNDTLPRIIDVGHPTKEPSSFDTLSSMCSICFLHNCMTHGHFEVAKHSHRDGSGSDEEDEDNSTESADDKKGRRRRKPRVFIDDPENENNVKREAKLTLRPRPQEHQCGVYCLQDIAADVQLTQIYGRLRNGTISGLKNEKIVSKARNVFADEDLCSEECFWDVSARGSPEEAEKLGSLTARERSRFDTLAKLYSSNIRGPCIIAEYLKPVTCAAAFTMLLELHNMGSHQPLIQEMSLSLEETDAVSMSNSVDKDGVASKRVNKERESYITSNSSKHEARPPFVPCNHEGPCLPEHGCSCAENDIHCEWFCNCAPDCKRRYKGCKCKGTVCFNDERCECWRLNRECDPWLCGNCGVAEVLDPSNKYREEIRTGRCRNNRIQLDLPSRTIKAPSEVQGWGLFAGEDLDTNTFIGEYKGEVISVMEGDRRGVVYHNIGQEYLFTMNKEQQIDGSNFGNKTRFMNNSQLEKNINVQAKVLLCNGVYRVMMYTKKRVRAGEELLYNYNYPAYVTKDFWERGEQPTNQPGVVAPLAKSRLTGRYVKTVANDDDDMDDDLAEVYERTPKKGKRKRALLDDRDDDYNTASPNGRSAKRAKPTTVRFARGTNINSRSNSDEVSDFDAADDQSTSEDPDVEIAASDQEEDEADEDNESEGLSHEYTRAGKPRQKRIFANDRRKGGAAQKKAWETRKANLALAAAAAAASLSSKPKTKARSKG